MPFPPDYKHSTATRKKISKNNAKHWLGTKGARFGQKHTVETKEKIRLKLVGRQIYTDEWRRKQAEAHKGKKDSIETRLKKQAASLRRYGLTEPSPKRHRNHMKYKLWRTAVLLNAAGHCQLCLLPHKRLEADHIKPWCLFPKLRYEVSNGRGLCEPCHRTRGWRGSHVKRS